MFSPVIKLTMIRIVCTIAISKGWETRQLDINNTFLNGFLAEDVCMMQHEGFIDLERPDLVCKLDKAIYGLK